MPLRKPATACSNLANRTSGAERRGLYVRRAATERPDELKRGRGGRPGPMQAALAGRSAVNRAQATSKNLAQQRKCVLSGGTGRRASHGLTQGRGNCNAPPRHGRRRLELSITAARGAPRQPHGRSERQCLGPPPIAAAPRRRGGPRGVAWRLLATEYSLKARQHLCAPPAARPLEPAALASCPDMKVIYSSTVSVRTARA